MFCPNCGNKVEEGHVFCDNCGARILPAQPEVKEQPVRQQTIVVQQREITQEELPERFRPLSAWAYFGYALLFAIPVVGFIFLIVFSCSGKNVNRRSFARSYWCALLLCLIAFIVFVVISIVTTGSVKLLEYFR